MSSVLFQPKWIKYMCHPRCACGWEGEPMQALKAAKAQHARHVRDECPIGDRRTSGRH